MRGAQHLSPGPCLTPSRPGTIAEALTESAQTWLEGWRRAPATKHGGESVLVSLPRADVLSFGSASIAGARPHPNAVRLAQNARGMHRAIDLAIHLQAPGEVAVGNLRARTV